VKDYYAFAFRMDYLARPRMSLQVGRSNPLAPAIASSFHSSQSQVETGALPDQQESTGWPSQKEIPPCVAYGLIIGVALIVGIRVGRLELTNALHYE